jgi:hypothetical protein
MLVAVLDVVRCDLPSFVLDDDGICHVVTGRLLIAGRLMLSCAWCGTRLSNRPLVVKPAPSCELCAVHHRMSDDVLPLELLDD